MRLKLSAGGESLSLQWAITKNGGVLRYQTAALKQNPVSGLKHQHADSSSAVASLSSPTIESLGCSLHNAVQS